MSRDIRRVDVVGGGLMGAELAEVFARAGLDTVVCEVDAMAARTARERVSASLDRAARRGKPDRDSARDALARPAFTQALEDLADRQLVVEAVVENAESLYDEFREPLYAPPPLLQRMVEAGLLGRRTGRGFHVYDAVRSQAFDVRQPGNRRQGLS